MPVPAPHRQPRYRAIADELRRRIAAGAIPAGALIPSESALTAEFRVARGTIREAINVLRVDGLVVTEHGRGTYARPNVAVRRLGPDRYRPALSPSDVVPSSGASGSPIAPEGVEADYSQVHASAEVARAFNVVPGTMLLQRRLIAKESGIPQQITTSYYLFDMVAGTPVADPGREPWRGGHISQLRSLGVTVTRIRETVRSRIPTTDEARILRLSAGASVLAVTRLTEAQDDVVEVAMEIVLPADRTELDYELLLWEG
ncbi:GntR family transcriptional regulator [Plantactinospora mayteni]|uniref:GntR family transcriptional regulator n=1 Tax=Plantactinospora mayteni TaxID=566021 RepID=UPI0035569D45